MLVRRLIFRYLRARRGFLSLVTGFALGGLALGVAALIVVMAVMTGFREELLTRILGMTGHATLTHYELSETDARTMAQKLKELPQITAARPYVLGQSMSISNRQASGNLIRGIHLEDAPQILQQNIVKGTLDNLNKKGQVAIGTVLARKLGLAVGSPFTLISPDGTQTLFGFIPRMQQVRVGAVFDIGMHQFDAGMIYMNMIDAQNFFRLGDRVTAVDVYVKNPATIQSLLPVMEEQISHKARISPWSDSNRQFFAALQVERVTMFIILALIVLVAAFNIITGQTMLVSEKRQDIGILRTMGATKSTILKTFFLNGMLLGSLGTGAGVALGLLVVQFLQPIVRIIEKISGINIFSGEVYFLEEIPAVIVPQDIVNIIILALVLTLLASIYPAWRAAKLPPVEVLRHG